MGDQTLSSDLEKNKDDRNNMKGSWIVNKKTHLQLIMGYIVLLEFISNVSLLKKKEKKRREHCAAEKF